MVDLIVDTFSLESFHSYRLPQQRTNESVYIITRSIETNKDCKIIIKKETLQYTCLEVVKRLKFGL